MVTLQTGIVGNPPNVVVGGYMWHFGGAGRKRKGPVLLTGLRTQKQQVKKSRSKIGPKVGSGQTLKEGQ